MNHATRLSLRIGSAAQRIAPFINGLLLFAFVGWALSSDGARNGITDLETLTSTAEGTESAEARKGGPVAVLAAVAVLSSFIIMLFGLWIGRRESRSMKAWLVIILLACGWLAAWLGRHDLYWYGHAIRVSSEVAAATELATALNANWPTEDGDYPKLGFVLGYPKQNPVTLILAGEPIPVGSLRIVAIEKSQNGETFRFQLADPNHDTWLVRSLERKELKEFTNGFNSRYRSKRARELSQGWWLIRYES